MVVRMASNDFVAVEVHFLTLHFYGVVVKF